MGVKTRHSIRSANPQQSRTVEHKGTYPVVAQLPVLRLHGVVQDLHLIGVAIIDIKSLTIYGDVKPTLVILRKAIDSRTRELQSGLVGSCLWLVTVQSVACTYPIISFLVTIDKTRSKRRGRMANDFSFIIKAENTTVLHRAPCLSVISHCQRRHTTSNNSFLTGETPTAESLLLVIHQVKTFLITCYP